MTTSTTTTEPPPLDEFLARAREWLAANLEPRPERVERVWGEGSDSVAVFHNMSFDDEKALIDAARAWQQRKADAGYASIDWAPELGGAGLPSAYARAFAREESGYLTPASHEAMGITLELIGPTIRAWGTPEQTARFLTKLRRTEEMWCQLFSEPGAGSDLARLSTRGRARRRRVGHRRPEGVDLGRPPRRLRLHHLPDRSRRAQARRAHRVHRADARAGRRRPPAAPDERRGVVQRGVLRLGARRRRHAPRRRRRRLAGGHDHARASNGTRPAAAAGPAGGPRSRCSPSTSG